MKKKNKIFTSIILIVFVLLFTVGALFALPMKASAATNTAGEYILSGTYMADNMTYTGYPSKFQLKISTEYFSEDTSTSVFYNGKVLNWTYFYFDIEGTGTYSCDHVSFNLTRNGSEYYTRNLKGTTGAGCIAKGELADGNYVLTYVGTYTSSNVPRKYTFTYNFTVDTTNPSYSLTAGGYSISNASYTNKEIKYSVSDANPNRLYYLSPSVSSYSYTTSTSKTVSAMSSNNGWWYFYANDDGGNYNSTVRVYLDTVAPVGKITNSSGTTLSSGSYTNKPIKYTATDTGGISYLQVQMPNSTSWTTYTSGTALSSYNGWYYFRAVDKAGNVSSTSSVYYDATLPTGTLYDGTSIKSSGGFATSEYIKFVPYDAHSGIASCYVKKPNASNYVSYTSGEQLTEEGAYSFYCIDRSGNTSAYYSITLDKTLPSAQLYVDGNKIPSDTYTNGEYVSFVSDGVSCYVKKPNSESYEPYISGTEVSRAGRYYFYALDTAGNSTGTYTVVIDRTAKDVWCNNVFDEKTDGDVTVSWKDGDADIYAHITKVTVNGVDINNGSVIHTINTGTYKIVVTDAAGNEWTSEFTSTKKNILTDTLVKQYYEVKDADGDTTSFVNYENAINYAKSVENGYVNTGVWNGSSWDGGVAMEAKDSVNAKNGTYYVYKKSGSPDEKVAYFTLDRLNEVIDEYAKQRVETCYYWQKTPADAAEGENLYTDYILDSSVALGDNIVAYLNGAEFYGTVIESEGKHTLTVCDLYGNSCDYAIMIVRNTPNIFYSVGGGSNKADLSTTYYFKDEVSVSVRDTYDSMAMLYVCDAKENVIGIIGIGESFKISNSGNYTVVGVNHAGETQALNIIVSRNAPMVSIRENEEEKRLEIQVTESKDEQSHIKTLEIYKSTDNGQTWELVTVDDYGQSISLDEETYSFRTSGIYKVVLTDEFYTGIEAITAQYAYEQKAPTGTLTGVENNGYTNGAVTFKWKDEATVTVTKDGEVIEYRSGAELRQDGSYTITIENFDGYKTTYSFVIDREAPDVIFNGTQKGKSVGSDVALSFTDKAVIYKNGELVGEYVSDTPITEDGEYRVVVSDLAGNETEINFVIDKTAPTLTLNGVNVGGITKESVTLSDVSEKADVKVFLNDDEIEYTLGDELSDVGKYKVIVTDACGNTTEYDFKIEQGANIGIIVLIVIAILAFGGVSVFFFVQKKNRI